MNESNHSYYDLARSWADERDAAAARSRRIAWTIAILACSVAGLEAVALALAMPLKRVVPVAVMVDRTTGFVQRIDLDHPATLTADAALQNALLAQYVVARESYDPIGIREAYRKVSLWSTGAARAGYLAGMSRNSPAQRLARDRQEVALTAFVKSISMIGPATALVRFDVTHTTYDGRTTASVPYVATMSYAFDGAPMRVEDRFVNPLGFQVRSYQVDPEAVTPAVDRKGGPDADRVEG